jgi:hypothetical protein
MLCIAIILGIAAAVAKGSASHESVHKDQVTLFHESASIDLHTREHWMRVAVGALHDLKSPCPFEAFGAVVVNHTSGGIGNAICIGVNTISDDGNPTLHGEVAALQAVFRRDQRRVEAAEPVHHRRGMPNVRGFHPLGWVQGIYLCHEQRDAG